MTFAMCLMNCGNVSTSSCSIQATKKWWWNQTNPTAYAEVQPDKSYRMVLQNRSQMPLSADTAN